ncbi:Anaphase-promoting complex subunit 10 [Coemansia spiralis]|uniref:Anaphase-promoting complex subunit 10 n=1 Tax=Coemansia spiralis TaxID=417178 RepID=A0A9W8GLY9_9FUNG|nr:Anaphase-promoting complex subunit 10 [Coemansia spiralis]
MTSKQPDISRLGFWTVSSSKQGQGVGNLTDNNTTTYWQSDGQHPHTVSIKFPTRHDIHTISIYTDIDKDESYTPCKIRILAGTTSNDLQLVKDVDLAATEPHGWLSLPLVEPLMAHFVQIEFPLNYENGRDVRIRGLRLLGPPPSDGMFKNERILPFTTPEFHTYESLR